ncbi:hypothetical protein [Burkholderia sp. Bp8963]|nr:hypothetical protein [Burkholderia sp. Bp8963]
MADRIVIRGSGKQWSAIGLPFLAVVLGFGDRLVPDCQHVQRDGN